MQENADGLKIEKHLRSAFSEGDGNLEAQFWYARQLYVNDKIAEASQRFEKLSEERVDPDFRQLVQAPWMREE